MMPLRQHPPGPPRWATLVVRAALPAHAAASHLADLDERFQLIVQRHGTARARRWYWRQAAGFAWRVPLARLIDTAGRAARPPGRQPARSARFQHLRGALARDVAHAARTLRARPGFTVPAVAILALAIAANSVVLSIVDNVLLRELPFPDADELVMLWDLRPPESASPGKMPVSYEHYLGWRARHDLFAEIMAMDTLQPVVETDVYPLRTNGMMISGSAFAMLGAVPARGRPLLPDDDAPGADPVAVISDPLWRTGFGADPGIVGRAVTIDGAPVTVVGVMAEDFWSFDPYMFYRSIGGRETAQPAVWRPLSTRDWSDPDWYEYAALRVTARLQPGVSIAAARTALDAMRAARFMEGDEARLGVDVVRFADEVRGEMAPRLLLLQGAVTLLVLIACVNVMSLVLAKASAQRAELAVRAALGAGRGSLVRLAIIESALLGLGGGALGLLGAHALGGLVMRMAPRELPLAQRVGIDTRVAALTLAVALLAGIIAGLLPALSLDFSSLTRSLRAGSRNVAGGALGGRSRFLLVAVEVTLTLVLLIGAAVLTRSFVGVWRTDPGFEARRALTFFSVLATPPGEAPDYSFHTRLLDELRELPGVESVGGTTHLPFSQWAYTRPVVVGAGEASLQDAPRVESRWITEGYLDAMGMRLLAGRDFERRDDGNAEPVIIINEAFAARFFPGVGDPRTLIGEEVGVVTFGAQRRLLRHRVVGVVGNVKHDHLFESDRAIMYTPLRQDPTVYLRFVVRTSGDPLALVPAVRAAAATVDRHQPLNEVFTLETLIAQSLTAERFYTQLLMAFGGVAFALAAFSVYGTVAYSARLRQREIGIRIAFGAQPGAIRRLVVGQGLAPVAAGVVAGCGGGALLVRSLTGLLHGVSPFDLPSFAAAAGLLVAVAAVAALIPARRAASVDPIEVLRSD